MSPFNKAALTKRALSAVVLAPLAFFIILYGGYPFVAFVLLCAAISMYEWSDLSNKTDNKLILFIFGFIYIALTFWCCYQIRVIGGAELALLFIVLVWASDMGAYFTGKLIGGPKLAEDISPNKTWAGYAGALILPGLISWIYVFYFVQDYGMDPVLPYYGGLARVSFPFFLGVMIGIAGQAGDLMVSWLKRKAGVKDSGALIPGHGGLLDRVDALMLAAPVYLFLVVKYSYVFTS